MIGTFRRIVDALLGSDGALVVSGGLDSHKPKVITVYDRDGDLVLHMVDGRVVSPVEEPIAAPTDEEHDALVAKFEERAERHKGKALVSKDRLLELTTAIGQGMKAQSDRLAAIEAILAKRDGNPPA